MKKYLFIAATAAAALASCTEQVEFTQESLQNNAEAQVPVQFGTYIANGNATRAMDAYSKGTIANATDATKETTDLKSAKFGVFAYFTGAKDYRGYTSYPFDWTNDGAAGKWKKDETNKYPNFMYNEKIYWSGDNASSGQWIYDVVKYWPNGTDTQNTTPSNSAGEKEAGKVSFFAFAPYTEATATGYSGSVPTGVATTDVLTNSNTSGVQAITNNTANTNVWVKYLMPDAKQNEAVDLLWGVRGSKTYHETSADKTITDLGEIYNENLTKQFVTNSSEAERVKFLFKHALAKIGGVVSKKVGDDEETLADDPGTCGFKVVVDVDKNSGSPTTAGQSAQTTYFPSNDFAESKTLVTLKEVKIQDGKTAQDDYANNGLSSGSITSTLANAGWFNIEEGKWEQVSVETTGATYNVQAKATQANDDVLTDKNYSLNAKIKEYYDASDASKTLPASTGVAWQKTTSTVDANGKTAGWTGGADGVGLTPIDVFANENVPGLLVIPGGTQDIYITVDYIVRTADAKLAKGYSEVEQVITNKVSLSTLNPNKYYTIIMHLGLTSVKFEAVVADWANTAGGTYDENGTYTAGTGTEATENREVIWLPSNVVK